MLSHPRNWGPTTVAIAAQREGAAWRPAKSPWLQPYANLLNRMQMVSQGCRTRAKCSSVFSLSWVQRRFRGQALSAAGSGCLGGRARSAVETWLAFPPEQRHPFWLLRPGLPCCESSAVQHGQRASVVVVVQLLSCIQLFATPWPAARQAPPTARRSPRESAQAFQALSCPSHPSPPLSPWHPTRRLPARQCAQHRSEARVCHHSGDLSLKSVPAQSSEGPGTVAPGRVSKVKVKVAQSCPTLCDPMDCTVHGILQARVLEGAAIPSSRGSSQPRDQCNWTVKYTLSFRDSV